MPEIIIKRGKGDVLTLKLKKPDFDVYRMAVMASQSNSGKVDNVAAGKIVLETCCLSESAKVLEEVKKDVKAFVSACLDAVTLIDFYNSEIKKN